MIKRNVFYSFHYNPDNWRAATVRNIGALEGNRPAADNDWETIKKIGEAAIRNWIKKQMEYRSCTVVLVGRNTANRYWINHEIIESWRAGMGVVGIYIHGLKDRYGKISPRGENPFDFINFKGTNKSLSSVVNCYNPLGINSQERYNWITGNISDAVEEAIEIRNNQ